MQCPKCLKMTEFSGEQKYEVEVPKIESKRRPGKVRVFILTDYICPNCGTEILEKDTFDYKLIQEVLSGVQDDR